MSISKLKLRLKKKQPSPLHDYLEHIANDTLLPSKRIVYRSVKHESGFAI